MTTNSRKPSHVFTRWIAACHGCAAGRLGLSVEEVTDTTYLTRLRRDATADIESIWADLADGLAALAASTHPEADRADVLPAHRDALIARAAAAARLREAEYELLCATYGTHWRRHHRDRRIAHLGWRCPGLAGAEEVCGDEC